MVDNSDTSTAISSRRKREGFSARVIIRDGEDRYYTCITLYGPTPDQIEAMFDRSKPSPPSPKSRRRKPGGRSAG